MAKLRLGRAHARPEGLKLSQEALSQYCKLSLMPTHVLLVINQNPLCWPASLTSNAAAFATAVTATILAP